jgi:tRNA/rRNA methyltransferase
MISNTRVVLFRPHFNGNVGSVARVMMNFGLDQLVLVQPYANHLSDEARRMATHGVKLLESAKIVDSIDEAVADCSVVLGSSGNVEGVNRKHNYGRPDEMIGRIVPVLSENPCALLFGPEPSGLADDQVLRCHGLIRIPTDSAYSSLNLSQAVTVCLYELRRQWLVHEYGVKESTQKVASYEMQERMFESLYGALSDVHFLWGTKADSLMHGLRHLITRAQPSPNEVRILFGLARQLRWVARNGVSEPPEDPFDG